MAADNRVQLAAAEGLQPFARDALVDKEARHAARSPLRQLEVLLVGADVVGVTLNAQEL